MPTRSLPLQRMFGAATPSTTDLVPSPRDAGSGTSPTPSRPVPAGVGAAEDTPAWAAGAPVQVQRVEAPSSPPDGVTGLPSPTSTVTAPSGAAGAPAMDLDELADRLYEPLSTRLRAELWLDRERAGLICDLRR